MTEDKCRICLDTGILLNIFDNEELRLPAKIMTVARITVRPDDGLPKTICSRCLERLNNCLEFITLCQQSSLTLKAMLVERGNVSDAADISEFYDSDNNINFLHADSNNVKDKEFDITVQKKTNVKLRKHQKEQCFTCGKVMSSRFRLKTHLRTHTGERPFSCPHCNKNFSLAQNLKVHLRTHTGEKPLTCTICGASFAQSAGLSAHRRKHTGQTPYKCTLCPRSFRTIGHMQYHVRRHTGEKKFECDVCGKAFIARSDMKQHLVIHTEDKPHVCCICGLRLRRASHLKRHMLQLHAQQKETVSECIKE